MKRFICIFVLILSISGPQALAQVTEGDIARKQLDLGVFLLKEEAKRGPNITVSPYSIHSALMLLRLGARGRTATLLDTKLLPAPFASDLQGVYATMNSQIVRSGEFVTSRLANSVWLANGYDVQKSYVADSTRIFESEPRNIAFSPPDTARGKINTWVSSATNALIPSLLPPGSVTELTTCVLVNALYFKAAWLTHFEKKATKEGEFWTNPATPVKVAMMHKTENMDYFEDGEWQGVRLPYQGFDFTFVVLVPKKRLSVGEVAEGLSSELLTKALGDIDYAKVTLSLPRLKVRFGTELLSQLSAYGLGDFQGGDYSGISARGVGGIGQILHEAVVSVDEEGTEAAAATAITMTRGAFMPHTPEPKEVKVDRPFVFALVHRPSRAPLFVGLVSDPR
ncbi:MAG: hypothetical protein RL518_359 [Pseudomonadota bacterium]|jgi:serpin B